MTGQHSQWPQQPHTQQWQQPRRQQPAPGREVEPYRPQWQQQPYPPPPNQWPPPPQWQQPYDQRQWQQWQRQPIGVTVEPGIGGGMHAMHAILTVFTCGLWAPIWVLHVLTSGGRRSLHYRG